MSRELLGMYCTRLIRGLITQFRLYIGMFNTFLKDVRIFVLSSHNVLLSLSRNANLICVSSSRVLLTTRDFIAEELFRLLSSRYFSLLLVRWRPASQFKKLDQDHADPVSVDLNSSASPQAVPPLRRSAPPRRLIQEI